jgi:hypothetical protein
MADHDLEIEGALRGRFPASSGEGANEGQGNPAIQLYGRRFYKDQTPVEYLAELLLVFASDKGEHQGGRYTLSLAAGSTPACYWPNDLITLKLFSFFPSSKLETRHPVHQKAYLQAISDLKGKISGTEDEKDETVRLLQSLFGGFAGVARNRTWATHSFLPASSALLSREVNWLHSAAMRDVTLQDWESASQHFATDRHNFMARGGELLFLQLAHLFSGEHHETLDSIKADRSYNHIPRIELVDLKDEIECELQSLLETAIGPIKELSNFIETALGGLCLEGLANRAPLGWVPTSSALEAYLFANELRNICNSALGSLEKIDFLQTLVCMQVLRSLCFQAQRVDNGSNGSPGFVGGYSWIVASSNAPPQSAVRKLAQSSFERIEAMLYRVLRHVAHREDLGVDNFSEADKHGLQLFRKLAKELDLVIPRTGRGQRFALSPRLLRFLVAALIEKGERVRLTEFYARVFAHYGIALGDKQLLVALGANGNLEETQDYTAVADTAWVEEALQQGGFLVELSDAVSIVHNPDGKEG